MAFALSQKICAFLVDKKLISKKDLDKARQKFNREGGSLGDILLKMTAISKEDLFAAISESIPFPPIKLARLKIEKEILELIPEKVSRLYQILPVSCIGNQLTVAMVDPLNIFALDDLKILTRLDVSPVIASGDDMAEAIRKHYEKSADEEINEIVSGIKSCLLYTSPSPRDGLLSRMPSSA